MSDGPEASVLESLFNSARAEIGESHPLGKRLDAISVLQLSSNPEDHHLLASLLVPSEPVEVQSAAITALGTFSSADVASIILARWSELTPSLRASAEELLFSRQQCIEIVLENMEQGLLSPRDISPARLVAVMAGGDPELQARARRLYDSTGVTTRADVLKQYSHVVNISGNASAGKRNFEKHCSACHRLEGVGHEIGPNLVTIKNRGRETILVNILDPNREINPEFLNYIVSLSDGRTKSGMIRNESAGSLTLLRAENQVDSLLRSEIDQIRNSGLSLMPEQLEKQMTPEQIADLVEYLMTVR
ncbi:c-type cytochrome [Planctomicrobium sp. SH661]|uniref:c-type cytochrome n=1 Tax=Planctomicrobium sp. SH661 TaxID=3448124 RepID=UPI003F5C0B52